MSQVDPWAAIERRLAPGELSGDAPGESSAEPPRTAPPRTEPPGTELPGTARLPIDGWTVGVKANLDVAGVPTSAGTLVVVDPAERDAEAVARLREAGAVIAATTTMAEAALGSVTANPWTGVCLNPHDPAFQAGGSSGGSAAAVAAGLVRVALGTDTMGSVRIPAACCGVVGWKPTRGAVPTRGLVPLAAVLDTVGVLARDAADALVIARIVLGATSPVAADGDVRAVHLARLRLPVEVDAAADAAVASVLESLVGGARRDDGDQGDGALAAEPAGEQTLALDPALVRRRGLLLCEAEGYAFWRDAVERDDPGLSAPLKALLRFGRDASSERLADARATAEQVEAMTASLFDHADVLVLPTLAGPPPTVGQDPPGLADLTAWVNLAGLPAVSVPTGSRPEGEPVPRSVQLVGRPGSDLELLALAATLTS